MNKKHAADCARALKLLGCSGVEVLSPAPKSYHVAGQHPTRGRLYLIDVYDAQKEIVELSRLPESK